MEKLKCWNKMDIEKTIKSIAKNKQLVFEKIQKRIPPDFLMLHRDGLSLAEGGGKRSWIGTHIFSSGNARSESVETEGNIAAVSQATHQQTKCSTDHSSRYFREI